MRKTILTAIGAALIAVAAPQVASANERHHVRKVEQFRRANNAIVATQPYILQAETQLGAIELLDACSGVTASLPLSGYFTTAGFARGHAAALRDFQSALNEAKASTAQLGTVQSVLRTLPGMSAREAALVTVGQYPTFLSIGQVQRVADLMIGTGMITNTVSVKNLVFR